MLVVIFLFRLQIIKNKKTLQARTQQKDYRLKTENQKMSEFKFKQFTIKQDKTAMKVSTDSVLLGAWFDFNHPKKILDVGTGTGLLAIMAAQKFPNSKITAVEIDNEAFIEAEENIKNCRWNKIIEVFQVDFIDFSKKEQTKYDLIVSNPPYFENQLRSTDIKKRIARHTDTLTFADLIKSVEKLMN
ncbi:MAG: methyltransferase, partial [Bacteroidota bacterium]|nr:methyltransferase [Bacteroidota bacterium]